MPTPKLPPLTWWVLTESDSAPVHARFSDQPRTICGGQLVTERKTKDRPTRKALPHAAQVKNASKRSKCQRCESAIERKKRMLGIH